METPLPTVDEVRAFFEKLNEERVSYGLDLLEPDAFDFDHAEPGSSSNCLSARNCYMDAGADFVGGLAVHFNARSIRHEIPEEILVVTSYFDDTSGLPFIDMNDDDREYEALKALRDRFVEAGIVGA